MMKDTMLFGSGYQGECDRFDASEKMLLIPTKADRYGPVSHLADGSTTFQGEGEKRFELKVFNHAGERYMMATHECLPSCDEIISAIVKFKPEPI
ncbi:hypothetical protein A9993_07840 [Rahnella victoriana]|uniref:hypothetical protein n=1 Tax=Rahnella victoriana TaxID=1510570 RepID=UPI000BB1E6F9|nr:hypothetical protein [Rahnella victoriana]PBI79656.1 hypothetical protein A9993_07840 [Rahnella victoriana]